MSMQVTLSLLLDREVFDLEEATQVQQLADTTGGRLYCWKTIGGENWLDAGLSIADVLGLVVLPQGLPDTIDMEDDAPEEGDTDNDTNEG